MKRNLTILALIILALGSILIMNQSAAYALEQPVTLESTYTTSAAFAPAYQSQTPCPNKRIITNFVNEQQVEAQGFHFEVTPPGGSYAFNGAGNQQFLSLRMDPFPFNGELSSSRITEVDTSLPSDQRVFCWQPTATQNVVVMHKHRFAEATPPPGLSQNIFLWNAPLDTGNTITAVGVTRSSVFGGYFAIVAQDFDFATGAGLLQLVPMPAWLDATAWHHVEIILSQETATIKVKQGPNQATVVQATLLRPPDPLGFEFSLDNEIVPGVIVPVTVADQLDIAFYGAGLQRR
ncbi:MAG: hypothetical protein KJ069_20150 [Anaerolineae bacterium]|nr:hypothetical protein [Anaerolineae bacterium]